MSIPLSHSNRAGPKRAWRIRLVAIKEFHLIAEPSIERQICSRADNGVLWRPTRSYLVERVLRSHIIPYKRLEWKGWMTKEARAAWWTVWAWRFFKQPSERQQFMIEATAWWIRASRK